MGDTTTTHYYFLKNKNMAIEKKLIHFGKLADFEAQLNAGNILDYSIVFIQDAKKIWTHGSYYDSSESGGGDVLEETDPVFSASPAATITDDDKETWNNKVAYASRDFYMVGADGFMSSEGEGFVFPGTPASQAELGPVLATLDDIPSEVTESTVSGWGFTKNTGTYSKPSGGIPKNDLASDVQSALVAAEAYKGTVSNIKINGSTKAPTNGVLDLGTVGTYNKPSTGIPKSDLASDVQRALDNANNAVARDTFENLEIIQIQGFEGSLNGVLYALPSEATGDEDDVIATRGTLKTINGESIFGSGDITISGGGSSSSSVAAYRVIEHGTSDTTTTIPPNVFHVWGEVPSLTIAFGGGPAAYANEYLFQFTSGSTATTLSLPDDIKWANDYAPTISANKIYQISVLRGLASCLEFNNEASVVDFAIQSVGYQANAGMTWEEWCNSAYNTGGFYIEGGIVRKNEYIIVVESQSYVSAFASDIIKPIPYLIIQG